MSTTTKTQKYSVSHHPVETILAWVKSGEVAIPEIQRPFVWDAIKVRDLIDSLYHGYPIGFLIVWRNPNIRLKDGKTAIGKKILIDGQQRVTALTAALLGEYVIDSEYKKVKIRIAFNPLEEKFEVFNTAIENDCSWISDIAKIFKEEISLMGLIDEYCTKTQNIDRDSLFNKIEYLKKITQKQLGLIELDHDLDIETVTEIFIRINSKGVVLSQADFAMSKIASNETYDGSTLRKCIDYFCHMAVAPHFYHQITESDVDFAKTEYMQKIAWLKNENDDLYDPNYSDLLRVAFTSEFNRGRLADLVSLLSGRNFETRTYEESTVEESFGTLKKGIINFINETNFKNLVMIIKSAGFISPSLIRSQNALNFAYILYLKLKAENYNSAHIERYVRRWFVLSILISRYSSSPESWFDYDIRNISGKDFAQYIRNIEQGELSDAFWNNSLVQHLNTSVTSSPYFNIYLASQVKSKDKGFLSRDISVTDLITHKGDVHHIFPKEYLKRQGLTRGDYNQIANYVYMQSEINIKIGKKSPKVYLGNVKEQCEKGTYKYGGISDMKILSENLAMNCIPEDIFIMEIDDYSQFLNKRRVLMAQKIKEYYFSL